MNKIPQPLSNQKINLIRVQTMYSLTHTGTPTT